MILLNLLPHREARRQRQREQLRAALAAAVLAGLLAGGLVFLGYQALLTHQRERNVFLQKAITALEQQIKEIASIESAIAALKVRQKAVENLQADRNLPVHLFNDLMTQLPEGVYLSRVSQSGQEVTLQGMAQSNERVSELLRRLSDDTPWLSRPQLVEIVAANAAPGLRDARRVSSFTVKARLALPGNDAGLER